MAITQHTKDEDERLKKELENADVEKFKKAVKQVFTEDLRMAGKKKTGDTRKAGRDASTGQFIPIKEAERRPGRTVIETIKNPPRKRK